MNSIRLHNKIALFQGDCFHDLFRSLTCAQYINSLESTLLMRNNICVHIMFSVDLKIKNCQHHTSSLRQPCLVSSIYYIIDSSRLKVISVIYKSV